jgi:signal transduction histidine kinase
VSRPATPPERRLVARGRWVLTGQFAAVITGVLLLVGVLAWGLMVRGQHADGRRELAASLASASVAHPWPCVWMFARQGDTLRRTPASPAALPVRGDLAAVSARHPVLVREHRVAGVDYLVRTEWHRDAVRQATLDLRYQAEERSRLYLALAVAELCGLLAAVAVGRWLAGRAIRPLAEALDRQQRFVADASHELRTPLTQIHTRAQLLARRLHSGTDPAVAAEEAQRLVDGSRQFGEVLDDLLLAAQFGPGAGDLSAVELGTLARAVAAAEQARLARRSLRLVVDAPDRYPVHGVRPALRRVLNALVDNAIGHTPAGGTVRLALRRDARHVSLTVADTGVGLDAAHADRIFERFARGEHGAGRRYGLGLALVREVVTAHGGSIEATGEPGRGAAFTVRLPVAPEPTDAGDGDRRALAHDAEG